MGNCLGSSNKGQRLGDATAGTVPASGNNANQEPPKNTREAMLAAAEQRRQQAENRGVKDGGKLSKQLANQKKQPVDQTRTNEPEPLVWD